MATRLRKSRTFAVVLCYGDKLGAYFIRKRTDLNTNASSLEIETYEMPKNWRPEQRGVVTELLKRAGLTVRFFDPEEKRWMDDSLQYGVVPAPGDRDGSWRMPDLETFEKDYLETL